MPITPLVGPAGAGKSQHADRELRLGEVLIDFTLLYAALANVTRGPDGRYPERAAGDPLLPLVAAVKAFALSEAVRRELAGFVTSSARSDIGRLESRTGRPAIIIDPGEEAIRARLADPTTGRLSAECSTAMGRWYR